MQVPLKPFDIGGKEQILEKPDPKEGWDVSWRQNQQTGSTLEPKKTESLWCSANRGNDN